MRGLIGWLPKANAGSASEFAEDVARMRGGDAKNMRDCWVRHGGCQDIQR
jgi:hypothetical protein